MVPFWFALTRMSLEVFRVALINIVPVPKAVPMFWDVKMLPFRATIDKYGFGVIAEK